MTTRVNATDVKKIISTSLSDEDVAEPILAAANRIVTNNLVGIGLSDETLADIELYLAAHMVALTEEKGGLIDSSLGDARERYANVYGKGLQATRYGQMALALDTTGTLSRVASVNLKAQFRVV